MKIEIHQPLPIHEIGQRDNQEDSLWPQPECATTNDRLFIVCDGMGGHAKGEVASQTVCTALGDWFKNNIIPDESFTDAQLQDALAFAYEELDKKDDGSFKRMGTTLTLLYIHRQGVTAAHMGDSRIYHIRPGDGLKYVSRDHSLVFDLFQAGEITYEEMLTFPQKNVITRAMQPGEENRTQPDIIHISDVQSGDYFYLCSDGMLERMENQELASILCSEKSDEEKRQQLIEATINNKDNHSAWILHIKDVIMEVGDDILFDEETVARCNALNITPNSANEKHYINNEYDDVVIVKESPQKTSILKKLCNLLILNLRTIRIKIHATTTT